MTDPDQDLRDLFVHQRNAERVTAPAFRRLYRRTPAPVWRWALAFGAAVVVAMLIMLQPPKPKPSLTQALPILLQPTAADTALFAELSEPLAETPSDFLLPRHLNLTVL